MALVGFARVSSLEQDLTEQVNALNKAGCERIFEGKNSGKKESNADRLKELQDYVREGDVVVVTKLDRLGRSVTQVLTVLDSFRERKIGFK
ncbi:recombinase family protein, partial [Rodentibacter caecimuris]|uniref:recombinase family protein n=1 Tax=Rodentibacter caecimuris TaxID=1796644 RepID=UPI00101AE496